MLLVLGAAISAQRPQSRTVRPFVGRGGGRGGRGQWQRPAVGMGAAQQSLARQLRQAFAGVVRRQLNLSDDQANQLQDVEKRFQQQRNHLQRDERQARLGLGAAMQDSLGAPDQTKIGQYMDQLVQAQHRRASILDEEQKELGSFLTPLQRAKYQALREQLNRRIAQMRQNAPAEAVPEMPPAPPAPPTR